jgi:hypothetical protein
MLRFRSSSGCEYAIPHDDGQHVAVAPDAHDAQSRIRRSDGQHRMFVVRVVRDDAETQRNEVLSGGALLIRVAPGIEQQHMHLTCRAQRAHPKHEGIQLH